MLWKWMIWGYPVSGNLRTGNKLWIWPMEYWNHGDGKKRESISHQADDKRKKVWRFHEGHFGKINLQIWPIWPIWRDGEASLKFNGHSGVWVMVQKLLWQSAQMVQSHFPMIWRFDVLVHRPARSAAPRWGTRKIGAAVRAQSRRHENMGAPLGFSRSCSVAVLWGAKNIKMQSWSGEILRMCNQSCLRLSLLTGLLKYVWMVIVIIELVWMPMCTPRLQLPFQAKESAHGHPWPWRS